MLELLKAKRQLKGKSSMCSGNKYQITITRKDNGESISFVYHDNHLNKGTLKDFMYAIMLDKQAYESCGNNVLIFAREFGYDDLDKAIKTQEKCYKAKAKIERLFTIEEIKELEKELTGY